MSCDRPKHYTAGLTVKYHGPTNTRCSRWVATLVRDSQTKVNAWVPFDDGPDYAAADCLRKLESSLGIVWVVKCPAAYMDNGSTYVYCVGPETI